MNERNIPADWWVAQDTAVIEQELYEIAAEAARLYGDELSKPWPYEQLELPLPPSPPSPTRQADPF